MQKQEVGVRWPYLRYTGAEIKRAGRVLVDENSTQEAKDEALKVVTEWRAVHAYPMQAFYSALYEKYGEKEGYITAARLKRLPSIVAKLKQMEGLNLRCMQDISGCRLIVPTIKDAYDARRYLSKGFEQLPLVGERDYIKIRPKLNGYRGLHLVYRHFCDEVEGYNQNTQIELQIRTKLQHQWATAVEMMGLRLGQDLKGGIGNADVLRFFALVSALFARQEGASLPEGMDMRSKDIRREVKELLSKCDCLEMLMDFHEGAETVILGEREGATHHLMTIDPEACLTVVLSCVADEYLHEVYSYADIEQELDECDVVLATVAPDKVRDAYPNYFADAREFVESVKALL